MILFDLVDRREDEVDEATGPGTGRLTRRAIVLCEFSPASGGGLDPLCDGISFRMNIASRLWCPVNIFISMAPTLEQLLRTRRSPKLDSTTLTVLRMAFRKFIERHSRLCVLPAGRMGSEKIRHDPANQIYIPRFDDDCNQFDALEQLWLRAKRRLKLLTQWPASRRRHCMARDSGR
jgi:hypothetical protein